MNAVTPAARVGKVPAARLPINAMSVDVEDYFQVQAFAGIVSPKDWDGYASRVEANTDRILAQFAAAGAHGTFFTLGWVAERHPALIRRIVDGGHELASHGYGHQPVYSLGESEFRDDVARARDILEQAGGVPVRGYRAPTFSMGKRTPWAHAVLGETGHTYSSSTFPIHHDLYGDPDGPRFPYQVPGLDLWELPMSTVRLGERNFPCSGGGYFRLLPYALFRRGLRRINATDGRSGIFYFHPWEVDPSQPRMVGASRLAKFRHYLNLAAMTPRLDRLLRDFAWDRIDHVFAHILPGPR